MLCMETSNSKVCDEGNLQGDNIKWDGGLSFMSAFRLEECRFFSYRSGSGRKDRRLSENSTLLDALMIRPSGIAGYETSQTESHSSFQGEPISQSGAKWIKLSFNQSEYRRKPAGGRGTILWSKQGSGIIRRDLGPLLQDPRLPELWQASDDPYRGRGRPPQNQ
jgi:hypothetical protein